MATQVTKFRANDGTEWDTLQKALDRDGVVQELESVMRPLGKRRDLASVEFVQHDRDTLFGVRRALWALVLQRYVANYPKRATFNPDEVNPMSGVGRVLCDSDSPLSRAWSRLCCINFDNCREYNQPYYAMHPSEATTEAA